MADPISSMSDAALLERVAELESDLADADGVYHTLGLTVKRAEQAESALTEAEAKYHDIMTTLRQTQMKHGTCKPRERRACTACNAAERLDYLLSKYKGPPVALARQQEKHDE